MIRMTILFREFEAAALAGVMVAAGLAGAVFARPMSAQSASPDPKQTLLAAQSAPARAPAASPKPSMLAHPSHYTPNHFPRRAVMYYESVWGIDSLSVRAVESGELVRFSYRVLDPNRATVFNNKKIDAFLDAPAAGARLVIPTLEKVGQLRQYNTPDAGKTYWMAFSNPRRTVKPGDRVNVIIGQFHADGLIVE